MKTEDKLLSPLEVRVDRGQVAVTTGSSCLRWNTCCPPRLQLSRCYRRHFRRTTLKLVLENKNKRMYFKMRRKPERWKNEECFETVSFVGERVHDLFSSCPPPPSSPPPFLPPSTPPPPSPPYFYLLLLFLFPSTQLLGCYTYNLVFAIA